MNFPRKTTCSVLFYLIKSYLKIYFWPPFFRLSQVWNSSVMKSQKTAQYQRKLLTTVFEHFIVCMQEFEERNEGIDVFCVFHSLTPKKCGTASFLNIFMNVIKTLVVTFACSSAPRLYLGIRFNPMLFLNPLLWQKQHFYNRYKNSINLKICENYRSICGMNWRRGRVLCN